MYDKKQTELDLQHILNEQFKSWMNFPDLSDCYKIQKHGELEHKFYTKNYDKYHGEDLGIRFYKTFSRWVKMNFRYCLETGRHSKQI